MGYGKEVKKSVRIYSGFQFSRQVRNVISDTKFGKFLYRILTQEEIKEVKRYIHAYKLNNSLLLMAYMFWCSSLLLRGERIETSYLEL